MYPDENFPSWMEHVGFFLLFQENFEVLASAVRHGGPIVAAAMCMVLRGTDNSATAPGQGRCLLIGLLGSSARPSIAVIDSGQYSWKAFRAA